MVRLRYTNGAVNILQSKPVLCNDKFVTAEICKDTFMYTIATSNEILSKGQGKTLSDCKLKVKKDLKLLGANFGSEIRNRGNTQKL